MNHLQRNLLLVFFITISATALLAIYVRAIARALVPELFFWIFAVTMTVGIMLLWAFASGNVRAHRLVLAAVLVSACILASFFFLRFYFYGADFVGEYSVAEVTYDLGRWAPERVSGGIEWLDWHFTKTPGELLSRYFSTTSVTILPAVIREVTGLDTRLVMWTLVCIVSVAAVVITFLIARLCFGERIATLSIVVFIFSSFYLGKFPTVLREDIALLFLLLAILCAFRGGKNLVVSVISLIALPMSHYGLVYFSVFILFLLFLAGKVYESKPLAKLVSKINPAHHSNLFEHRNFSIDLLLSAIVIGFAWLVSIAYAIFVHNVGGLAGSMESLLGLATSQSSYFQGHVMVSSLGLFHTAIQWLERILAVFGFLIAIRSAKTEKAFILVFAGGGLLAGALTLAYLPGTSSLFDLDRTMHVSLIAFSIFIAFTISNIYDRKIIGKIVSIALVTLILLETLQVPILYLPVESLSRESYIFSFTHSMTFYELSDFEFVKWTDAYTGQLAVFASDRRGYGLCLLAKRMCVQPQGADASDTISLLESGKTDYVVILSYVADYISFTSKEGVELELNSTQVSSLIGSNRLNRIYDSSRVVNFAAVESNP